LSTKRDFAIKVLDKRHIIREKKVKYVNIEKNTLYKLDHPGIVKLYSTFQDNQSLCKQTTETHTTTQLSPCTDLKRAFQLFQSFQSIVQNSKEPQEDKEPSL
jgi:serine/threonine protein kinase